jgi:hypothetical protein
MLLKRSYPCPQGQEIKQNLVTPVRKYNLAAYFADQWKVRTAVLSLPTMTEVSSYKLVGAKHAVNGLMGYWWRCVG